MPPPNPAQATAQAKVLVVDDEHAIADTFVEIFRCAGYDARAAYSAETALEEAKNWHPNVAIIDVILPAMNGLGLAAALEIYVPQCQVLMFSGQEATPPLLAAARTVEMNHIMFEKPIHPKALLDELAFLLSGKRNKSSAA
jgi:DNA-binding NtrC family response regulator